ncbi:helix-turn-helix domain-containing protein [Sphingomonas aracearum]|uniref:XRE family transcriptional regulator n=1 Tax=Sphingomonas aracearum TaxID=2283317 RepID=A0A369W0H3_9SPHN|nr:helix-turn-helix transcriptional regulator [Sphingomonas aracearum]RDE05581.1 XRE family transcriptional regulator [Sphingomonas aracearum]
MKIEQCRAARALLGWSSAELAQAAGLGPVTVRRFESGQAVQQISIDTMRTALEAAGVVFIQDGETSRRAGVGVRLAD